MQGRINPELTPLGVRSRCGFRTLNHRTGLEPLQGRTRQKETQMSDTNQSNLTDEIMNEIAARYQERDAEGNYVHSLADLTREFQLPRATLYWALYRKGIVPDRIRRPQSGGPTVEELLHELAECRAELTGVRLQLEREQSVNTYLMRLIDQIAQRHGEQAPPAAERRVKDIRKGK